MTSPSLRNRPTTRPSTRLSTRAKTGWLAVGLFGVSLFASVAPMRAQNDASPLDRLRTRSAAERWAEATRRHGAPAEPKATASRANGLTREVRPVSTQEPVASFAPAPAPPAEARPVEVPALPVAQPSSDPLGAPEPSRPLGGANRGKAYPDPDESARLAQDPTAFPSPELRRIGEILPFYDYEPDIEVRLVDPYRNVCPRPEGGPAVAEADVLTCPDILAIPGGDQVYGGRAMPPSVYAWAASNIHYNPLYFEDPQLERYGHTYPCYIQPFDSAALFGLQLIGLPYQMTLDPICKCVYPLGYYRPGECAPKLHYQIPLNARAAAVQAAVTTGVFYVIP